MLVGWVHYLAFDLFAGMWIARDADQKGFSRIVQFPLLVLTLLAGPVGLLAWLIVRERRARALARAKSARSPGCPGIVGAVPAATPPRRCATAMRLPRCSASGCRRREIGRASCRENECQYV